MVAIAGMICTLIFVSIITGKMKVAGAMMLLLVGLACVVVTFADELRLDALLNGNVTEGSNGRMEGYAVAMELFMDSPLFGVGAADADLERYGIGYNEIHNTILNFATKFGLLATIPVLLLFVFIAIKIFQTKGRIYEEMSIMSAALVMVSASVFVFTEPVVVFGNFHNTMLFWFVMGVFLGRLSEFNGGGYSPSRGRSPGTVKINY